VFCCGRVEGKSFSSFCVISYGEHDGGVYYHFLLRIFYFNQEKFLRFTNYLKKARIMFLINEKISCSFMRFSMQMTLCDFSYSCSK
jgi:hypothetical protein